MSFTENPSDPLQPVAPAWEGGEKAQPPRPPEDFAVDWCLPDLPNDPAATAAMHLRRDAADQLYAFAIE
jgi:hypothetical protein